MSKLGISALGLVAAAFAYSCGSSDNTTTPREGAGAGGEVTGGAPSEPSEGGAPPEAGAGAGAPVAGSDADGGDGGRASGAGVVLPEGTIVNVPYTCDSPFEGVHFTSYYHLEDFEDHLLNVPGVTAPGTVLSSGFSQAVVDSVDCDDGVIDDACANCEAIWGSGTIELIFDEAALGELPSHVGLVWTDGGANSSVTITGYDTQDAIIYTESVEGIGDAGVSGTTDEDRFFGIVSFDGVKRVVIVNSTGGVEIDHLQYGR